ncbi:MAG: diacylglycerol kinase family protein [Patescibacteria group bacterium]
MRNRSILKSFQKAGEGFIFILKTHKHFKFQILIGIFAIIAGMILRISYFEWLILILIVWGGLIVESFNTALEEICNLIQKQHSYTVKIAKDISGAGVLLFVICSLIISIIIFAPKILLLFNN